MSAGDLSGLSNAELVKLEREVARKYSGGFPWFMVIWGFTNVLVWLSLWPLVLLGWMPLWLGFVIATLNMILVYLPTHDAQHDIIGRRGQKWRWLNEGLGHATTWLMVIPFNAFRYTHLAHHRYANDPDRDPDYGTHADGPWGAIWAAIQTSQPKSPRVTAYFKALAEAGREDQIALTIVYKFLYVGFLSAMAWSGFALEAFLLWWLPLQIGNVYLSFFLSWAPHNPGLGVGRYKDTRSWKSKVGNVMSLGMQYHTVHHLHPYIPLNKTPAAFREMKPILIARGVEIGEL